MAIIQDRDKPEIQKRLAKLEDPVTLVNFTQELECQYCRETHQLVNELADLSDKLNVEVYNFVTDREKAREYKIDKIPATALVGERDYGIRFYGVPAGYEFATLLDDLVMVSNRDSMLSEGSRKKINELKDPLHIQVFVTPT
jgi:glutaredoxin-like protein